MSRMGARSTPWWFLVLAFWASMAVAGDADLSGSRGVSEAKRLKVFLFAGQSNMVGSDAHASMVDEYPPFSLKA